MKKVCWIGLLLMQGMMASAQIGAGDTLGIASIPFASSVGVSAALGTGSLPHCNPALTTCASALPLILLDFEGKRENALYVGLDWRTTAEVSNAGFWVDRSFGNTTSFNPVFFVPALQNNDLLKDYQRPDTNSYTGKTFYRLQQIDLAGKGTYSNIIEVDGMPANGVLKAFPNPSQGLFTLQVSSAANGQTPEIRVYNSFGQVVYVGRSTTINLGSQPGGIYTVEVAGDKTLHGQVLILR